MAGCAGSRLEGGIFHSKKGYRVAVPPTGWRVVSDGEADLTLAREEGEAGMLTDATCGGAAPELPARLLSRHLLFGLVHRSVLEQAPVEVAGHQGLRTVVRGAREGVDVTVEGVVLKGEGCVYDFLYVAPSESFEGGRAAFDALVESFARETR